MFAELKWTKNQTWNNKTNDDICFYEDFSSGLLLMNPVYKVNTTVLNGRMKSGKKALLTFIRLS